MFGFAWVLTLQCGLCTYSGLGSVYAYRPNSPQQNEQEARPCFKVSAQYVGWRLKFSLELWESTGNKSKSSVHVLCDGFSIYVINGAKTWARAEAVSFFPTVIGAICFGCIFLSEECCDPFILNLFVIADKSSQSHAVQYKSVEDKFSIWKKSWVVFLKYCPWIFTWRSKTKLLGG